MTPLLQHGGLRFHALICIVAFPALPQWAVMGNIAEMMKEIGAFELSPEMIRQGGKEKPQEPPKLPKQEKPDPLKVLHDGGLEVSDAVREKIKTSPELVKQAELDTIAESTQLAMYQRVRCSGCKAIGELLALDIATGWKASLRQEAMLERVQVFCDGASFPGSYQVVLPKPGVEDEQPPHLIEYRLEKSTEQQNATAENSAKALRRICHEHINTHDTEVAEKAMAFMKKASKKTAEKQAAPSAGLQEKLDRLLCRRTCSSRKAKTEL